MPSARKHASSRAAKRPSSRPSVSAASRSVSAKATTAKKKPALASSTAPMDSPATVLENTEVAPGFWRMAVRAPTVAPRFQPGQFFQLRVRPDGGFPLLRRPFAPSEIRKDGFAFIYAVVGDGTKAMTRLMSGADVSILAPLGNGYMLPAKGARAVLVGGGCGTPSLRVLAEALDRRGVEVFSVIGARTACTLLERNALEKLSTLLAVATDDGSDGLHGHAVDATRLLLDEIDAPASGKGKRAKRTPPILFGCGPKAMLKGLAELAQKRGLACQVSLEERMACGFGACMGCVVAVKAATEEGFVYKRVCADGPVFDAAALVW